MQDFFDGFCEGLSHARIQPYLARTPSSVNLDVVTHYLESLKRAQALLPGLHLLEVVLRNQIHRALTAALGVPDWYDTPGMLKQRQLDQLNKTKQKIAGANKAITPDYVVAESTFGFWVGLFAAPYEHTLIRAYPNYLRDTFPYAPRYFRVRDKLSARLSPLRDLRNRVTHWEYVVDGVALSQARADIEKLLSWMNPAVLLLLKKLEDTEAAMLRADMREVAGACFAFEQIGGL